MTDLAANAKTSEEIMCAMDLVTRNHEFVNRKWVPLETAQKEVKHWQDITGVTMTKNAEYFKQIADAIKILDDLIEDMTHVPSRRLPLGKNAWLMEWSEVQEKARRLCVCLKGENQKKENLKCTENPV